MGSRKMTRKLRAQRRERAELLDSCYRSWRESGRKKREEQEGWARETRVKYDGINRRTIEDLFEKDRRHNRAAYPNGFEKFASALRYSSSREYRSKLRALLTTLSERAPDLVDRRYYDLYISLSSETWIRPLDTWKLRGKSDWTRFRSLVDHLLVKYPMPEFLYQLVSVDHKGWNGISFFARIARGAKVASCFNGFFHGIPMTKRMGHHFMQMPAGTPFFEAVRNAQVEVFKGDKKLARAISRTFLGRGGVQDEDFWVTVIKWFCEQSAIDCNQVGPLFDYIRNRHEEDPDFSMKGRTSRSLTRSMEEWHRHLAIEEKIHGIMFKPSGFREGFWELFGRYGKSRLKLLWTMEEILSSKDLHAEGRAMRHCVYYYVSNIQGGDCSIWSLKREGDRALTIEVMKSSRMIVQARGKCNRSPKRHELSVLKRWAQENRLKMDIDWCL